MFIGWLLLMLILDLEQFKRMELLHGTNFLNCPLVETTSTWRPLAIQKLKFVFYMHGVFVGHLLVSFIPILEAVT